MQRLASWALLSLPVLSSQAATATDADIEDMPGGVCMLQTRFLLAGARGRDSDKHREVPFPYPDVDREQGICRKLKAMDLLRPIRSVISEQPEDDGWCVMGGLGDWTANCAVAHRLQNMTIFATTFSAGYAMYLNANPLVDDGPKTFRLPGGQMVTIRDHFYPLDDVYCFVNGWYNLNRDQALHNHSYLLEVSRQSCAPLDAEFYNISMKALPHECLHPAGSVGQHVGSDGSN
ncbi:unnamed protein product [Symbiodinium natans]|uniref:Uncharacterized protein n=1 Tax=Symbiodinium natans TaxID=878477 RepID=A0A812JDQ2_9DINO|nr:unnamed protein product [Symbiodinium natans]